MGNSDGAIGRVDRLPAGTRRTKDVDPKILLVDLNIDLLGLGQDRNGGGRVHSTWSRRRQGTWYTCNLCELQKSGGP